MTLITVTNVERRPDGSPWEYGLVQIGVVGAGFDGAGGQVIGVAKDLTDGTGLASIDLEPSNAGEWYVWTGPDLRQVQFIVPGSGGPYTLQSLSLGGVTLPGVPSASAAALAALAAEVSGISVGDPLDVATAPAPSGGDDSAALDTAATAAVAANKKLLLRPGALYRVSSTFALPTGLELIAYGATVKVTDSITAPNILTASGAVKIRGGTFDGNKASTTAGVDNTSGNGFYIATSGAGWSGTVDIRDAVFQNCQWGAVHVNNTDSTLHDPENAPAGAVYTQDVQALNCAKIAMRFTGIAGVKLVRPVVSGAGSHGIRFFLCKNWAVDDGSSCDNPTGHGLVSLYSKYTRMVGGQYNRNGTTDHNHSGVVFGGDSTSNVNMPGQFIELVGVTAIGNGQHNILFDASLSGTNTLLTDADYPSGRGSTDPVPVFGKITDCVANGAVTGDGIIVTSSQHVTIHNPTTDGNVAAHGISIASRNVTVSGMHKSWYNGQKPLALQGAANWGDHDVICATSWHHNTPDDTMTLGTMGYPCRFAYLSSTRRAVTTTDTAAIGETLALDTTGGTFVETLPEISFAKPGRINVKWVAGTVPPTLALTGSDKVDTTTGTTLPLFSILGQAYTLESDPATGVWTVVASMAAGGVPAVRLIGGYDASVGNFPLTGGSGSGGAVAKGDAWFITIAGSGLFNPNVPSSAISLAVGNLIYALQDVPGNNAVHWGVIESKSNRDTDGTLASNSDLLYPTQKAVKTYVDTAVAPLAPLASPAFTGSPTAPTQTVGDASSKIATDAFVATGLALKASLGSPALTGTPTAPTQSAGDNSTKIATTAYADTALALKAPLASPALTGNPTVPTQSAGDNSTKAASTAYVDAKRLDQAAAPTADVSLNSHKLTNVTDPASAQDAATKNYVDTNATVITANNQTGTTYTLVLGDAGLVVECNNASAITLTIPPHSSVAFPVGTVIEIFQQGAGQVTVAQGSGVTIRSPGSKLKIAGQYSSASLRQRATDEWCLEGDIST